MRLCTQDADKYGGYFNPRTPRGVRHAHASNSKRAVLFQSTHPARGATSARSAEAGHFKFISIHAPREGCDFCHRHVATLRNDFNPRTPRGVRPRGAKKRQELIRFQSTHPARGATRPLLWKRQMADISIHAPREGCDPPCSSLPSDGRISIHAPREGCDLKGWEVRDDLRDFNPRTPRGVRQYRMAFLRKLQDFNPRTPRGVRPFGKLDDAMQKIFQSTHPARGATTEFLIQLTRLVFQSTHPARGATPTRFSTQPPKPFQSTHPARGATAVRYMAHLDNPISIHAPREGCDLPRYLEARHR